MSNQGIVLSNTSISAVLFFYEMLSGNVVAKRGRDRKRASCGILLSVSFPLNLQYFVAFILNIANAHSTVNAVQWREHLVRLSQTTRVFFFYYFASVKPFCFMDDRAIDTTKVFEEKVARYTKSSKLQQ